MGRQAGNDDNGIKQTVKTWDRFTKWDGWDASDIKKLDHQLVSINVDGEAMIPALKTQYESRVSHKIGGSRLSIGERHYFTIGGTYKAKDLANVMLKIVKTSNKFNLRVKSMITKNTFGDTVHWETFRGEMILVSVNGKHYTSMNEKDIIIAADEMYFDGCEVKRDKRITGFVCGIGPSGEKIHVKSAKRKKVKK